MKHDKNTQKTQLKLKTVEFDSGTIVMDYGLRHLDKHIHSLVTVVKFFLFSFLEI